MKTGIVLLPLFFFLVVTGAHILNEEEFDILSDVSTSVRCSKSKLSFSKADALYTWEVEGFLNYLRYLRDFGSREFRHSSGKIVYDSEKINGEWNFELRSTGQENFVTATYTYQENKDNQNGNFGVKLKIFQPNFGSIKLSILKPTEVTREKVFVNGGKQKHKGSGSSYIFSYPSSEEDIDEEGINTVTLKFQWPAISASKFLDFQYENTELIFAFMIHAYFPADVKTFRKTTCNLDNIESKYFRTGGESIGNAPGLTSYCKEKNNDSLVRNSYAMFANPVFSDFVVRVENIDIPVHGVVLYHSSSRLASLVLNATKPLQKDSNVDFSLSNVSRPVITISDDIGYKGTYEMLRYIYTGKVENLDEHAPKIIVGADRYDLPGLKSICEQTLIANTNLSNVINTYVLAIEVSSSRLVRKAFAVIQANRANIVSQSEEFRKLSVKYPNLMFELFIS